MPLHLSDPAFAALEGQPSCDFRSLCGGGWSDPPAMIRSGARDFDRPPGASLGRCATAGGGPCVARDLDR